MEESSDDSSDVESSDDSDDVSGSFDNIYFYFVLSCHIYDNTWLRCQLLLYQEPASKKPAGAAKNGTVGAPAKKGVPAAKLPESDDDSSDDDSSDESSDDVSSWLRMFYFYLLLLFVLIMLYLHQYLITMSTSFISGAFYKKRGSCC